MTKYKHNTRFFATVTSTSCYWAGFIAADGNLHNKQPMLRIGLQISDRLHLEKFKSAIGFTGPIKDYIRSCNIAICAFSSNQKVLCEKYSITPAKSNTLLPPRIDDEEHIRHFIRGYFDGDGYIGPERIAYVGTEPMMIWIRQQLRRLLGYVGFAKVSRMRDVACYRMSFCGRYAKMILDWLYSQTSTDIRLERKYLRYKKFYHNKQFNTSTSPHVGVHRMKSGWVARISYCGQREYLGYFTQERDAVDAYQNRARELNFNLEDRCYASG